MHPGRCASVALLASLLVTLGGFGLSCKSAPPKNYLHSEWSMLESANPTEIGIVKVDPAKLPHELPPEVLRDAIRDQILAHRFSPLSFDYIDRGNPLSASAAKNETAAPHAVKLELFVTTFDASRYDTANTIHVAGDFLFTDASNQTLLGTVKADQMIDMSGEARRNVSLTEAVRTAAQRFVETALAPMPTRRVEATEKPASRP